jgi:hypothetical protein
MHIDRLFVPSSKAESIPPLKSRRWASCYCNAVRFSAEWPWLLRHNRLAPRYVPRYARLYLRIPMCHFLLLCAYATQLALLHSPFIKSGVVGRSCAPDGTSSSAPEEINCADSDCGLWPTPSLQRNLQSELTTIRRAPCAPHKPQAPPGSVIKPVLTATGR